MPPAEALLRQVLAQTPGRALPWVEVMRLALYDPQAGYYRYPRRIGRGGDFYTAVTVGSLYGQLLAELALQTWERCGRPAEFWLIESGAHDGQLAADVWRAAQSTALAAALRYAVVENRDAYLVVIEERLRGSMGDRLRIVDSTGDLRVDSGLILWNELADALPCERVRWTQNRWVRLGVRLEESALVWCELDELADSSLPRDLPEGYTTELNLLMLDLARDHGRCLKQGAFLIADYGYSAAEYYHADRVDGTLRRYQSHRSDAQVLQDLGHCDLTAHIDFSAVQAALEQEGWKLREFTDQGRFLTHLAAPWLRTLDGHAPSGEVMALLRQFQTLTHPTHMGAAFRCLLMESGYCAG